MELLNRALAVLKHAVAANDRSVNDMVDEQNKWQRESLDNSPQARPNREGDCDAQSRSDGAHSKGLAAQRWWVPTHQLEAETWQRSAY